jgi:hypothetical protein
MWHNHNELTHPKKPVLVESSKRFLQSYLKSLLVIKQNEVVNVDKGKKVASYVQGFRKENEKGEVILAACWQLQNFSDAQEAELAAMKEGIDLDIHWSSGAITLDSDCLMAIKLTRNRC